MDSHDQLFELITELADAQIQFVVCGGVACVLHGVERATYDLDIAVSFEENNIRKLIAITEKFGMIPRIPEPADRLLSEEIRQRWITEKNAMVFTFVSTKSPLQLDLFLTYPIPYHQLMENAETIYIERSAIHISSIDDLLAVKKTIDPLRKKDIIDIEELERILTNERSDEGR